MNQIQETVDNQIGFSLANITMNERLDRFYIPVGLVHPKSAEKQTKVGGSNAIPAPTYTHKGQYGGTVNDEVMNNLLNSVTVRT